MYTNKSVTESQLIDKVDNSPCEIWIRVCYSKVFVKVTGYVFHENAKVYAFTFWEPKDKLSVEHKNIMQIDLREPV